LSTSFGAFNFAILGSSTQEKTKEKQDPLKINHFRHMNTITSRRNDEGK
jgi:hypothetical protein